MTKKMAQRVRDYLEEIAARETTGRVTSAQLVALLKAEFPEEIKAYQDELVHSSLMRLAGDVGRVDTEMAATPIQLELLADYGVRKSMFLWSNKGGAWQHLHTPVDGVTSAELRGHVEHIGRTHGRRSDPSAGILKLADDMDAIKARTVGEFATRRGGQSRTG